MKYAKLPNNRQIAVIDKFTAAELYNEIYKATPYVQEGFEIRSGDVVIDIGGNIGMWSMFVLDQTPKIRLITIEPVPQIFEVLQENIQTHQPPEATVTLFNLGLGEEEKTVEFNYYPRSNADSTATPVDFALLVENTVKMTEKGLLRVIPRGLKTWVIRKFIHWIYTPQKVDCQLKTLSQIIKQLELERIDFIKLDAENAEREVLAGISEEDWPKIEKLVIEAHTNIPGGHTVIDDLTSLLQSKGFTISIDYHSRFSGIGVHMMYALRA